MKYLITGGTGSLGEGLLKRLKGDITILSRSEKGQIPLKAKYPKVKFILGDVRDYHLVRDAVRGMDIVIHAAGFKFLDLAETQTRECALTNVVGSINVVDAVRDEKTVKKCLGISTDKVAYARNAYGASKHIMEKLFREADGNSDTIFACVRYGNVLGTTGSVHTIWERQLAEGKPLTVTDEKMRRFFFTLDEAVDLVLYGLEHMKGGEIFCKKMQSYNLYDMARELSDNVEVIGMRPGEKMFETLIADYEGEEFTSEFYTDSGEIVTI